MRCRTDIKSQTLDDEFYIRFVRKGICALSHKHLNPVVMNTAKNLKSITLCKNNFSNFGHNKISQIF